VTYEPGPAPTVSEIKHNTWLDPEPHSRTVIGVKEAIELWVESWQDPDIQIDDYGVRTTVYDSIGDVVWTACPGRGEFHPPVAPMTEFTAGFSSFDDGEQILAQIWDSRKMGLDYPVGRTLGLTVKVPSGNVPYWYGPDERVGLDGPPNKSMGVGTYFAFQIQPNTANFCGIYILETRVGDSWPWPNKDMSKYTVTDFTGPPHRPDFEIIPGQPGVMHNILMDWVCTREGTQLPWKTERLLNQGQYQSVTFPVKQRLYFQIGDDPLTFKFYQETTHPRSFSGTDFKSKVGWQGNGNAETQNPRGPYRDDGE